jgi:nitroreductase
MEMLDIIKNRVSVRSFQSGKQVPEETLIKILEAGRMAPSAANRQPWHFYMISDKDKLSVISGSYQAAWFKNAPHVLVVVGNREKAWKRGRDGYNAIETDLTIAMDHMILTADSLGIGTCWIAAFDPEILYTTMELDESEVIYAITPLGYPEDHFIPRKKDRKDPKEVYTLL